MTYSVKKVDKIAWAAWSTYIVVLSPPATKEIGREIEYRQGIGW
jgi:hypothetical protein